MPVREALRALAAEGVVTLEPRRGASVTTYSPELIQELVEVRATLEALNAKLAAKRHDPEQIARLERIVPGRRRSRRRATSRKLQEDNADFHEALASVAANSVLTDIVRSLRDRTALIFAPHSRKRARQNWDEHAAIVRAVIAGDAELAALLAARHVYSAAEVVPHASANQRSADPRAANDAAASALAPAARPFVAGTRGGGADQPGGRGTQETLTSPLMKVWQAIR